MRCAETEWFGWLWFKPVHYFLRECEDGSLEAWVLIDGVVRVVYSLSGGGRDEAWVDVVPLRLGVPVDAEEALEILRRAAEDGFWLLERGAEREL